MVTRGWYRAQTIHDRHCAWSFHRMHVAYMCRSSPLVEVAISLRSSDIYGVTLPVDRPHLGGGHR